MAPDLLSYTCILTHSTYNLVGLARHIIDTLPLCGTYCHGSSHLSQKGMNNHRNEQREPKCDALSHPQKAGCTSLSQMTYIGKVPRIGTWAYACDLSTDLCHNPTYVMG